MGDSRGSKIDHTLKTKSYLYKSYFHAAVSLKNQRQSTTERTITQATLVLWNILTYCIYNFFELLFHHDFSSGRKYFDPDEISASSIKDYLFAMNPMKRSMYFRKRGSLPLFKRSVGIKTRNLNRNLKLGNFLKRSGGNMFGMPYTVFTSRFKYFKYRLTSLCEF